MHPHVLHIVDHARVAAVQVLLDLSALRRHPAIITHVVVLTVAGVMTLTIDPDWLAIAGSAADTFGWSDGERVLLNALRHIIDGRPFDLDLGRLDQPNAAAVIYALAIRWGVPVTTHHLAHDTPTGAGDT